MRHRRRSNLTLEITGTESNGYHTLDTLFCWLELHDTLELETAEQTSLELVNEGVSLEFVTADEENLVLKALRALEAWTQKALPTRFVLHKRIPAGGGLGGGSADAAAALLGLRELHELKIEDSELHGLASKLGADVAFGLRGGFARGRGYGDRLEELSLPSDLSRRTLILLAPGFACPTPSVYRAWDEYPQRVADGATQRFLNAEPRDRLSHIANDLEPAASRLFPVLSGLKREMRGLGLEGVCLSGSGSTLFGFASGEGSVRSVEKELAKFGQVTVTHLKERGRCG